MDILEFDYHRSKKINYYPKTNLDDLPMDVLENMIIECIRTNNSSCYCDGYWYTVDKVKSVLNKKLKNYLGDKI